MENASLEMALSHCRLVSSPALTIRDLMDGKGIQGLALHPKARLSQVSTLLGTTPSVYFLSTLCLPEESNVV